MSPLALLKKNSPVILAGAAVCMIVGAVISAVKATPEAEEILDSAKEEARQLKSENFPEEEFEENHEETRLAELAEDLPEPVQDVLERLKENTHLKRLHNKSWRSLYFRTGLKLGRCYLWTLLLTGGAIACVIGSQKASALKYTAALSMLSSGAAQNDSLKKKVRELIGDEQYKKLQEQVDHESMPELDEFEMAVLSGEIEQTGDGDQLFYDPFTERYFYSSVRSVQDAITKANTIKGRHRKHILRQNTLLTLLGLVEEPCGYEIGWDSGDSALDCWFHHQSIEDVFGELAVIVIDWSCPAPHKI